MYINAVFSCLTLFFFFFMAHDKNYLDPGTAPFLSVHKKICLCVRVQTGARACAIRRQYHWVISLTLGNTIIHNYHP